MLTAVVVFFEDWLDDSEKSVIPSDEELENFIVGLVVESMVTSDVAFEDSSELFEVEVVASELGFVVRL